MRVAGLITAAGLSSRMGEFKPLLRLGGTSVIVREAEALREAGCEAVAVVTGHRAAPLTAELAQLAWVVCLHNPDYASTQQLDSVKLGLAYWEGRCDALLYAPADVPLLSGKVAEALLACGHAPARPVYAGRGGHPLLLPASLLPALRRYAGPGGLRGALEACTGEPYALAVDDPGAVRDVDTPEDWAAVQRLWRGEAR